MVRVVAAAALSLAVALAVAPALAKLDQRPPTRAVKAVGSVKWPLDLVSASVRQSGLDLLFSVETTGLISAKTIGARRGRSLCLDLYRAVPGAAVRQVCLRLVKGRARMVRENLSRAGTVTSTKVLAAVVRRPAANELRATFRADAAGIGRGPFRWRAASTWTDDSGCIGSGCADILPARPARLTFKDPIPAGCRAGGASYRANGARRGRTVALSYDDGPSNYTPRVLDLLKQHRAHATFFEIGNQMAGRSAIQRRILAEGHSIGNHSWSHPVLSGGGSLADSQLRSTKAKITSQTGFTPCLFRPPYGAKSPALIRIARSHGMLTINWDVDPADWSRPGTGAIISRVMAQVRPGSIILMHDGGGDRSQSVAATGTILRRLAGRGYRVVTVETLLGLSPIYR